MNIRQVISLILFVSFANWGCSQVNSDEFKLEGVWEIVAHKAPGISAMSAEQSDEWIGRKATIDKRLYFEYQKIESYRELFPDSICDFKHSLKRRFISAIEYFDGYKISPTQLDINTKEILVIETACSETPFGSIIVKDNNTVIINWDGVFFYLSRKESNL